MNTIVTPNHATLAAAALVLLAASAHAEDALPPLPAPSTPTTAATPQTPSPPLATAQATPPPNAPTSPTTAAAHGADGRSNDSLTYPFLVSPYRRPHVVSYEGGEIPSSAHFETRPNIGLITGGLLTLAIPYSVSLFYALGTCGAQQACRQGSDWLYVPIVGPFITATQAPTTGGSALSAFDGMLQLAGAAMTVAGIALPRKVVVWQDDRYARLDVTPAVLPGGGGFAVTLSHL